MHAATPKTETAESPSDVDLARASAATAGVPREIVDKITGSDRACGGTGSKVTLASTGCPAGDEIYVDPQGLIPPEERFYRDL